MVQADAYSAEISPKIIASHASVGCADALYGPEFTMRVALRALVTLLATVAPLSEAVELNVTDSNSVKNATRIVAYGLVKYYTGNITDTQETVGILPQPYYWWEAGAMWGALLDYYHFTGDSTYNNVTTQALLSQVGPLYDYMVPRQQKDEGNDDQAFWGFATMSAAEKDYPQPTVGNYSWVELTENLWNTQVRRWDETSCNGGLKWQIFSFNSGYDYKNSVSNGAFFQLSARLARFTGNQTYVDWAEKSLTWSLDIGLITQDWHVYDGTDDTKNCSDQDRVIWTYSAGIYLYGSAIMYNYTNGSSLWETRTQGFLNATGNFFSPYNNATDIMFEPACETIQTCDNDQYSFKGYLSRFMWASTLMAPFTTTAITTLLRTSSLAAAQSCSGGFDGVTCGEHCDRDDDGDGDPYGDAEK
ncbi:6-D-mannanase DCW1 [Hyphodiscus hymeniophilus]|uniref:Mannan endo-1,6-alpha-mannosidase n=1 Tax=Hyphodiscus hymeniophilus TaxID=353542 RepID=A0A9P6VK65_9HELO|nr:6-D-mannanase DCW1 [Hyphodiscus hymeniophilus]